MKVAKYIVIVLIVITIIVILVFEYKKYSKNKDKCSNIESVYATNKITITQPTATNIDSITKKKLLCLPLKKVGSPYVVLHSWLCPDPKAIDSACLEYLS